MYSLCVYIYGITTYSDHGIYQVFIIISIMNGIDICCFWNNFKYDLEMDSYCS